MAEKINATCCICGAGYHMCLSCNEMAKLNPWKRYTDTSEHYKVYQVLHGVSIGVYDKSEAKSKLQMIDLSDKQNYRDHIRNMIDEILKEEVQLEEKAEPVEEASPEKVRYVRKKKQSDVVEEE